VPAVRHWGRSGIGTGIGRSGIGSGIGSPALVYPCYSAAKRLDYVKALLDAEVQKELKDIADMCENAEHGPA
jgi:hypothetical protein